MVCALYTVGNGNVLILEPLQAMFGLQVDGLAHYYWGQVVLLSNCIVVEFKVLVDLAT